MRKLLLTLSLMIAFTIQVVATNYTVTMKSQKKENPNNSTQVRRTPTHLPFEVIYDDETHKVIVSGDEAFIAHIYVCDENGNTLDSSSSINAVLNVPESYTGLLIIRIENDEWISTGKIVI